MSVNKPNQTLYVNNLNEKVKIPELKKALYSLFSLHGPVLDIVAHKGIKKRGQAFVVYKDLASATEAKSELQGFNFFSKPMRIDYAKQRSKILRKFVAESMEIDPDADCHAASSYTVVVTELPRETTEAVIMMLFNQIKGLSKIELLSGKQTALVRYDSEEGAKEAISQLNGFKITPSQAITVKSTAAP
eukprot:Clim_evm36s143 gene=Clim_evmTU36s143